MNVLSLFDGMSGGRIALDRANIEVGTYYASEIDKYAIKVSEANYPNIVRLGDVTKWREWDIDWNSIDLVIAGFPCQAWSVAGKQLGDKDPRGMLFWTMLDIISRVLEHNPNARYLLENVKMKRDFEKYITHHTEQALGEVYKTLINSSLVSAQIRQRYYWTNFPVSQPEDKGITWGDVREHGVNEFYYTEKGLQWLARHSQRKNKTLSVWTDDEKAQMIEASHYKGYSSQRFFGVCDLPSDQSVVASMRGRRINPDTISRDDYDKSIKPEQYVEFRYDGLNNCLSTVNKDNIIVPFTLPNRIPVDMFFFRYVTPLECERLQTVPDGFSAAIETLSYSLYNYREINNKEDLYLCDVKLMDAKENREQKSMVTYALCTTSDLLGMELMNCQRLKAIKSQSVNIAIERLEKKAVGLEECVVDITKTGLDMETLYTQIRSEINLDQEATKSAVVVKTSTGRLLRITSEGSCQEVRLFTILIAIRLITQLRICTYVTDRASIHYCIDSLKESQGNLLSVDLSYLKMETTRQTVSNTQRYKMLGNGFTVDVIAHILKGI